MSRDEQISTLRELYAIICGKCYQKRFQLLLAALLRKDPNYYQRRQECIHAFMNVIENALILEEADRALHYLICLEKLVGSLNARMQADQKRYWKHLPN